MTIDDQVVNPQSKDSSTGSSMFSLVGTMMMMAMLKLNDLSQWFNKRQYRLMYAMRFLVVCCFVVCRRCCCCGDDQIWLNLMEYCEDKDEDELWCVAISTVARLSHSIKKWHSVINWADGELHWIELNCCGRRNGTTQLVQCHWLQFVMQSAAKKHIETLNRKSAAFH